MLSVAGCGEIVAPADTTSTRDREIQEIQREAGAPVSIEVGETGNTRILTMTPRFPVPGHATDPAIAAKDFLVTHHDAFQLDAAEVTQFVVARVDVELGLNMSHVTLQRVFDGIPVYRGAIIVHIDGNNGVFRVVGDDFYGTTAPTNRMILSPREAAIAAGRGLGVALVPTLESSEVQSTTFTSPGTLDPVRVEPRIFQVAPGDSRFAYQVLVSWLDLQNQQQYQLTLIDAHDGSLLASYSLVDTFTGRVFASSPGTPPKSDTRVLVSFDGDPAASPNGWVGPSRNTVGNNAAACTDRNADNSCAGEVQPIANASNSFDFPVDLTQNAWLFPEAAVTSAFFLVNNYHDRTYRLGFTEAAGNFQTNNFGRGGAQNDAVNVDAQDGLGTNNANFATPPDGMQPRMQMFLFTLNGGPTEDGDFDPTVIFHENSHGLSNRLVGGGGGGCLGGLQSGGMGEGWGDFMAASFLNNPVVGAYVTGNATRGIRRFPMNASPWTYDSIKNGMLAEVHDVGELWAATLWDVRNLVGAAAVEQLVVSGMKLTPCRPTMLQARDAILSADQNINGGADRCRLWTAFAGRLMGTGASSPDHNSTSAIVTSNAVPADCVGHGGGVGVTTHTFTSTDVRKSIPDKNPTGVRSVVNVTQTGLDIRGVLVDVDITHTFVGDLVIQVIAPDGETVTLSNLDGGPADNFTVTGLDITLGFRPDSSATGQWQLFVRDLAGGDVGTINSFALHIASDPGHWSGNATPNLATSDNSTVCTDLTMTTTGGDSSRAKLDISGHHDFCSALSGTLAHNGSTVLAFPSATFPDGPCDFSFTNRPVPGLSGDSSGIWTLCITDNDGFGDTGVLNTWSMHD